MHHPPALSCTCPWHQITTITLAPNVAYGSTPWHPLNTLHSSVCTCHCNHIDEIGKLLGWLYNTEIPNLLMQINHRRAELDTRITALEVSPKPSRPPIAKTPQDCVAGELTIFDIGHTIQLFIPDKKAELLQRGVLVAGHFQNDRLNHKVTVGIETDEETIYYHVDAQSPVTIETKDASDA